MSVFQVRHGASGAILWTGEASSQGRVIDLMAAEAGFRSGAELPNTIRGGGLIVEALRFEQGRPATGQAGERATGGVPLEQVGAALGNRGRSTFDDREDKRSSA